MIRLLAIACSWLVASSALAEEWHVEDAVARALQNPDVEGRMRAELEATRAETREETVVPTPTLVVAHEEVLGDMFIGYSQLTVGVEQELDLSRWRSRMRDALPHREEAIRAGYDDWRVNLGARVREAFFSVVHRRESLAALAAWVAQLERAVAAIAARVERGDASLYDSLRVRRELDRARAAIAREQALLSEAWAALRVWAPFEERPALAGDLTPTRPDDAAHDVASLPSIRRLAQLELALDREADAWGSPFWRGWTLGAGYRWVSQGDQTAHGFTLNLSIPLAFWNTDRARVDRLEAERDSIAHELSMVRTLAERRRDAARERLDAALHALGALTEPDRDQELTRLAETSYRAGESPLSQLLDAYESEVELRRARLDLQWEARRAAIELERRSGTGASR